MRFTLGSLAALFICCAPAAHAQTMHWFWNVDINGSPADTSQPVLVSPGDEVLMSLSAEMQPAPFSFAGSIFALTVTDGDSRALFHQGTLDYAESNGYGRNPYLASLSHDNGTPFDSDADGAFDTLDQIDAFQLPHLFCRCDDRSNPIIVYSMLWTVGDEMFDPFTLDRAATSDDTYTQEAYIDDFGTSIPYDPVNKPLTFNSIPAPPSALALGAIPLASRRRR